MSFDSMFSFISTEERKKKQLAYQKNILPLGLEQKNAALNAIRPLINSKINDSELLYIIFVAKQAYIESEENPELAAKMYLKTCGRLSETEKRYILALIKLDANTKSLEDYPNTDDVLREAD